MYYLYKDNTIFTINHSNTNEYGVLEKNLNNKKPQIIEKPKNTKSKRIVVGIYIYNYEAIQLAKKLKPSKRKELEITDLNNMLISILFKSVISNSFRLDGFNFFANWIAS